MEQLTTRYARKLVAAELAEPGEPLIGMLDADISWNRKDAACDELAKVFAGLGVNSLLLCRPAEPYRTILDVLASHEDTIRPKDCETRTFIHDLPVRQRFIAEDIADALRGRKSVIVREGGAVITAGAVSPEQAIIVFSSVCFASFVKFFSDYLACCRRGEVPERYREAYAHVEGAVRNREMPPAPCLLPGPFDTPDQVINAMDEAGRKTVEYGLVDSFFGNISYRLGDTIYISQTSSSLDELPGCIDPCPIDGSSCAAVTASSELTAHRAIVEHGDVFGVLHGHPKFSVIMSMDCPREDCEGGGECHRRCPHARDVCGVPVVPGEVGRGPFGLCNTVPGAMECADAAIVYGHGVFTTGKRDFNDAFARLLAVENDCRAEYFRRVEEGDGRGPTPAR